MPAPVGNQHAVKAKRWSLAIDAALAKRCKGDGVRALEDLAEKLLLAAEGGDVTALKELGDRLEGKPAQTTVLTGDQENPVVIAERPKLTAEQWMQMHAVGSTAGSAE